MTESSSSLPLLQPFFIIELSYKGQLCLDEVNRRKERSVRILQNEPSRRPVRTLLIEDNTDYANLLRLYLARTKDPAFEVEWAPDLTTGLSLLGKKTFDVVLTDLTLPDSAGINTFNQVVQHAAGIAVVVLTALDDEKVAVHAVKNGAEDYLIKGDVEGKLIARVLLYAIERNRMRMELKSLSLTDELTGLRNRRGFITLGDQQCKLSRRNKKGFLVVMADLDGLKKINDTYGHAVGDQALVAAAKLLESTFRQSDILARIGGDEFAVIAIDADKTRSGDILERLRNRAREFNAAKTLPFELSLSMGAIYGESDESIDLNDLLRRADQALYEEKKLKKH